MNKERAKDLDQAAKTLVSAGFVDPIEFSQSVLPYVEPSELPDCYRQVYSVQFDLAEAGHKFGAAEVRAELKQRGHWDSIGGGDFVGHLVVADEFQGVVAIPIAIRELKRINTLNRIAETCLSGHKLALLDSTKPEELGERIRAEIEFHDSNRSGWDDLSTVSEASHTAISRQIQAKSEGKQLGMPTGYPTWDEAAGGFHRGQLILLSGRTYSGKTAAALNLARYFAMKNRPTLFACLEMKDFELSERLLCIDAQVALSQWATGDIDDSDFERLTKAADRQAEWPMVFSKSTTESVASLRAKARLTKARFGSLDLVVVDHLQRLTPADPREQRYRQLIEATSQLKNLARQLDCAVLLLSQLKTDHDGEPTEADYSEAKGILQEADQAILLHRQKDSDFGEFIVAKNRRGSATRFKLNFEGRYQRFVEPETVYRWPTGGEQC